MITIGFQKVKRGKQEIEVLDDPTFRPTVEMENETQQKYLSLVEKRVNFLITSNNLNPLDMFDFARILFDLRAKFGMMAYGSRTSERVKRRKDIDYVTALVTAYYEMCHQYKQIPTMLQLANYLGVDNTTLYQWTAQQNDRGELIRSFKLLFEEMLLNNAIKTSQVGSIFALKALYGYKEDDPQVTINVGSMNVKSVDEIASKYQNLPENDDSTGLNLPQDRLDVSLEKTPVSTSMGHINGNDENSQHFVEKEEK